MLILWGAWFNSACLEAASRDMLTTLSCSTSHFILLVGGIKLPWSQTVCPALWPPSRTCCAQWESISSSNLSSKGWGGKRRGGGRERRGGGRRWASSLILEKMHCRQYSHSLSACRQEHTDPLYIHMWELMSAHQHKSSTSPSPSSFMVLQFHNYCVCLAGCCLIYVWLYFLTLLMYYSSSLSLTVSSTTLSFMLCRWHSINSHHFITLC